PAFSGTLFGETWYRWETSVTLPNAYWSAGAVGWQARVRTRLTGSTTAAQSVQEGFLGCVGRVSGGNLTDFTRECSSPMSPNAIVCTSGFQPNSSRHSPCPRDTLIGRASCRVRV